MSSSYKSFAVLSFSGSRKPIGRLSEDVHVFLHVDGVCFAKQPLGHLDLLFAPPPRTPLQYRSAAGSCVPVFALDGSLNLRRSPPPSAAGR